MELREFNGRPAMNGKHTNQVAFDDAIPARGPELFIKRMKGGESRLYVIVGTTIRGIWIHWNQKTNASEPHMQHDCPGCKHNMAKRWKGFIHCYDESSHQEVFLELTPTSAAALQSAVLSAELMRGTVVTVTRGAKANSRLSIHVQAYRRDPKILLPEKDPRPSILKLWGMPVQGGTDYTPAAGLDHDSGEIGD